MSLPSVAEVEEMHRAFGEMTLFTDLLLVSGKTPPLSGRPPYLAFCRHMLQIGLGQATFVLVERVGMFTVLDHRSRKQRDIWHGLRSERRCRALPPTLSFTGDGLVLTSVSKYENTQTPFSIRESFLLRESVGSSRWRSKKIARSEKNPWRARTATETGMWWKNHGLVQEVLGLLQCQAGEKAR